MFRSIFSTYSSPSTSTSPSQRPTWGKLFTLLLAGSSHVSAIELNVDDDASIKSAASTIAFDMMSYYTGNRTGDTPGNLPDPYFWWECGAMFGAMVDYWFYTNDTSYVDVTTQALLSQVGPDKNYMPPNQTSTLGNDDQAFWALSAMAAAEYNFPNPPSDQPQWLALAQGVFNSQVPRWDTQNCGGGLRWQIFSFNAGFDYKNSISNGAYFNLASRLARYTGNDTYTKEANKAYDWMSSVGLIDNKTYAIVDGSHDFANDCKIKTNLQWSYNVAIVLHGAANMYNLTNGSAIWEERVQGLLNATQVFFDSKQPNVMVEVACETVGTCNNDQLSFKAYLARWMAATTRLAPFTHDQVMTKIRGSAQAAAQQCSGGSKGTTCGQKWTQGKVWDGSNGVGQAMSALEVVQSTLLKPEAKQQPLTEATGGTSVGDPSAGTIPSTWSGTHATEITTGDKAGAGIITTLLIVFVCGGSSWIIFGM